jgi:hypothetical protein
VADTERWVASKGAKYPYAYDKGGRLASALRVPGYPDAVLVDPTGTIVWHGHPGALDEATIQAALSGALPKPLWEWSGAAKAVKSAFVKRDLAAALALAAKLTPADGGPEILAALQAMVRSKVDAMRAAREKGDFRGALDAAAALKKECAGLPEVEDATKLEAELATNAEAKRVLEGQKKVAKIVAKEPSKKKELKAAIEDLVELKKEYAGTYVEVEATALIEQYANQANS